jgi:hypothetical protein
MPDQVTGPAIRDAIAAVLGQDSTERSAARQLAGEIAEMPPATHAVQLLASGVTTRA